MSELYLIAHKVRGEPAFDVAVQVECPECHGVCDYGPRYCLECESLGYWWIIPTSGHRAYPYWSVELMKLAIAAASARVIKEWAPDLPSDLPDHYAIRASASTSRPAFLDKLRKPVPVINRRGL